MELTPEDGAVHPIDGTSGFVPNWTAKGTQALDSPHRVRPGEALAGPAGVDNAYQVPAVEDLVGQFGEVAGSMPKVYSTQPRMFPLAQPGRHDAEARQDSASPDSRGETRPNLLRRRGFWPSGFRWSLKHSSTTAMRAACTIRRHWARPARWRPDFTCAGQD